MSKVLNLTELIKAITERPSTFIRIVKGRNFGKGDKCDYAEATVEIQKGAYEPLWINIAGVKLINGLPDPKNKDDPRNRFENASLHMQTTLSHSGLLGQFLSLLQPLWLIECEKFIEANPEICKNKGISNIVRDKLSKKNKTNPSGDIVDPLIKIKADFKSYSLKYPLRSLAGKPRSRFYDARYKKEGGGYYDSVIITENAQKEQLNMLNLFKYITHGTEIVHGRLNMSSIVVSGQYISWPILADAVVVLPGTDEFTDDFASMTIDEKLDDEPETPEPPKSVEMKSVTDDDLGDI